MRTPLPAEQSPKGDNIQSASLQFVAFGVCAALLLRIVKRSGWRQAAFLAVNLLFLACISTDARVFIPFAGFVALGFAGLRAAERGSGRTFGIAIGVVIAAFLWLKKYSVVPTVLYLKPAYVTVGLSYILFRVLHLIIEARNRALPARITFLNYLNYTLNFTTLISGPIQRYGDFAKYAQPPPVSILDAGRAIERIIRGFFKTNILALLLAEIRAASLTNVMQGTQHPLLPAAIVFAGYPLFLYCNFSGYIDIVIGLARLMGIVLPENFDRPFSADSFIGFWSRWHITLSNWLQTYVYNPLLMALMRRFPRPSLEVVWGVAAFFTTFFLVGVWHGQTPAFLFFGVLQGAGVSVNKVHQIAMARYFGRKRYKALSAGRFYVVASRGLTFTWFAFTLLWFWSDWRQLADINRSLGWGLQAAVWLSIWVGSAALLAAWESVRSLVLSLRPQAHAVVASRYWRTAWSTALVVISAAAGLLLTESAPEIVYKNF